MPGRGSDRHHPGTWTARRWRSTKPRTWRARPHPTRRARRFGRAPPRLLHTPWCDCARHAEGRKDGRRGNPPASGRATCLEGHAMNPPSPRRRRPGLLSWARGRSSPWSSAVGLVGVGSVPCFYSRRSAVTVLSRPSCTAKRGRKTCRQARTAHASLLGLLEDQGRFLAAESTSASTKVRSAPAVWPRCQTTSRSHRAAGSASGTVRTPLAG